MGISQVRKDTGLVPMFTASLVYFRVTIPRTSPVTAELRDWAIRMAPGQHFSQAQIAALGLAHGGYDIDIALLRRLGLGSSEARRQLGQLRDLGLLRPCRTRDDGSYRLAPGLPGIDADPEPPPSAGNGLADRILQKLSVVVSASREELQAATGASRSSVTNALDGLIGSGMVAATAPPRSPNRRYRRAS